MNRGHSSGGSYLHPGWPPSPNSWPPHMVVGPGHFAAPSLLPFWGDLLVDMTYLWGVCSARMLVTQRTGGFCSFVMILVWLLEEECPTSTLHTTSKLLFWILYEFFYLWLLLLLIIFLKFISLHRYKQTSH